MPEQCWRKRKHKADGDDKDKPVFETEFNKMIETRQRTQADMKMELEKPNNLTKNYKESLPRRMKQRGQIIRTWRLIKDFYEIKQRKWFLKNTGKECTWNMGNHEKTKH